MSEKKPSNHSKDKVNLVQPTQQADSSSNSTVPSQPTTAWSTDLPTTSTRPSSTTGYQTTQPTTGYNPSIESGLSSTSNAPNRYIADTASSSTFNQNPFSTSSFNQNRYTGNIGNPFASSTVRQSASQVQPSIGQSANSVKPTNTTNTSDQSRYNPSHAIDANNKNCPSSTQLSDQPSFKPSASSTTTSTQPNVVKCMKRSLFPTSPSYDDRQVTPIKRKRGLDSPPSSTSKASSTTLTPSSQARHASGHNVPLSERQQLAMILKMTDETLPPDVSPKPISPGPPAHKRTPVDKKVNKRNERGETILHLVAIKGDIKQTKKYIKAGADVNAQDFAGWTALHEACNHGWIDVTRQLLKAGANVNAQGLDNDTPLHDASGNGHTKLVELLLKHGANPLQANCKGKTPVDVAASEEIIQLLKKELFSSNSDTSSVEDARSPTSPESASSTRDDEQHSNLDDFAARVSSQMAPRSDSTTDAFNKQTTSKSPDNKPNSPRLFLKFQHIKFKDSQTCDSTEQPKETNPYKSYSVTLETSDRTTECFSPFNSASSNESDSNESKLDISRRLKAVDASLTEQDELLIKREAEPRTYPSSPFITSNSSKHITSLTSGQFVSSLSDCTTTSRSKTFGPSFPPLVMETSESLSRSSIGKTFSDSSSNPLIFGHSEHGQIASSSMNLAVDKPAKTPSFSYQSFRTTESDKMVTESSNKPLNPVTSFHESVRNSATILCERTGEQVLPTDDASNEQTPESTIYDTVSGTFKSYEPNTKNAPKVPPLKIILPTKTTTLSHDSDSLNCSVSKLSLPYVVNSANVIENEATSSSVFNLDTNGLPMFQMRVSDSISESKMDEIASSSTDPLHFAVTAAVAESTCVDDGKNASENEASEGSGETKAEKEERRITRSLRSHMTQLQQKDKNDKQGSDSNDANSDAGVGTKSSRDDVNIDDSTDVPPRKRKLRPKPEPIATEILPPNPMSLYELPPNPYQVYLTKKRSLTSRQEALIVVHPKEPQGFKDYLMVSCGYVLQGNTASTLAVPMLPAPNSVSGPMRELFTQQEKARYKLRLQHLVEREKLTLASEQEILRVHGRAARASVNQTQPLSVCTVLKDEELYPTTDFEQQPLGDDRDKNNPSRSRYNGRQFLSWLQDVADKYDKLKELLILRHHHEAESLYAVQKMDWEWKMKSVGICEHNATPKIDDLHVPMVQVSDE